jgi:uncharacterized delta-60 repeat protein
VYAISTLRFSTSGALDTSFGASGAAVTMINGAFEEGRGVGIDGKGRVVVGGYASFAVEARNFVVLRYDATGKLDSSFGTGGVATTDVAMANDEVRALVLQPDDKIVVAGVAWKNGLSVSALARYGVDGVLDASFGQGGIVADSVGGAGDELDAIALGSGGSFLTGGWVSQSGNHTLGARYTASGVLDATFGAKGFTAVHIGGGQSAVRAVATTATGKPILAGWADPLNTWNEVGFSVTRLQ